MGFWIISLLPGSQVYKGIWQGNTPVAVKFVTGHSPKEQQRFRNEVAILKSLRHVNIVQFLGASMAGDQIMLVTEYMPRGDLWRALSQDSTHHFSWRNMCAHPCTHSFLGSLCHCAGWLANEHCVCETHSKHLVGWLSLYLRHTSVLSGVLLPPNMPACMWGTLIVSGRASVCERPQLKALSSDLEALAELVDGVCGCRGWQVALHIARGLHHMHSRKVMHLDLKSANILLARDGTAKVADVGLAKILTRDNTHVSMEGTFDWAAPEVHTPFLDMAFTIW